MVLARSLGALLRVPQQMVTASGLWRRLGMLLSGTPQSGPTGRDRLVAKPVVRRADMPNSVFGVRRVRIAVSRRTA